LFPPVLALKAKVASQVACPQSLLFDQLIEQAARATLNRSGKFQLLAAVNLDAIIECESPLVCTTSYWMYEECVLNFELCLYVALWL